MVFVSFSPVLHFYSSGKFFYVKTNKTDAIMVSQFFEHSFLKGLILSVVVLKLFDYRRSISWCIRSPHQHTAATQCRDPTNFSMRWNLKRVLHTAYCTVCCAGILQPHTTVQCIMHYAYPILVHTALHTAQQTMNTMP